MQPELAHTGAGGAAPLVLRTRGGSLIAFRHADGSVTRLSDGTRFTVDAADSAATVRLEVGSSWHRAAPAGGDAADYRVHVTAGHIHLDGATAILVCEDDGECFVGTVCGRVEVHPRAGAPVVVDAPRVAWIGPDGHDCLLFDDMALDELEDEQWIRANLELDHELEIAVRREAIHAIATSATVAARATGATDPDVHLARDVDGPDGRRPGGPGPHRRPPANGGRGWRRAAPYLLVALTIGSAAAPAVLAAVRA